MPGRNHSREFKLEVVSQVETGQRIKLSRRMGHVYDRAVQMVQRGQVDLAALATHRFGLEGTPEAFALHADYQDGVIKSVVYPFGDD